MRVSRRAMMQISAAAAVASALGTPARASGSGFRALVGVRLAGGSDGWNMIVPADKRHESYRQGRGAALALPRESLAPLAGSAFGLHPALAPLAQLWTAGRLNPVLNTGALIAPLTKADYRRRPDLRPDRLMLHDGGEAHWGDCGLAACVVPDLRRDRSAPYRVDAMFADAATGKSYEGALTCRLRDVARQLEARDPAAASLDVMVAQHGHDTHADQTAAGNPAGGTQGELFADLAQGLRAFDSAMALMGLADAVTVFTYSEFGRAYRVNGQGGTEHGWGNNHLIMGAAATPRRILGAYPDVTLGGPQDVVGDGRFVPGLSAAEYLAPIARWRGGGGDGRLLATGAVPRVT